MSAVIDTVDAAKREAIPWKYLHLFGSDCGISRRNPLRSQGNTAAPGALTVFLDHASSGSRVQLWTAPDGRGERYIVEQGVYEYDPDRLGVSILRAVVHCVADAKALLAIAVRARRDRAMSRIEYTAVRFAIRRELREALIK